MNFSISFLNSSLPFGLNYSSQIYPFLNEPLRPQKVKLYNEIILKYGYTENSGNLTKATNDGAFNLITNLTDIDSDSRQLIFINCFIVASVGPGICMILASYSGCNTDTVVILFTASMGLMGAFYPGMKVNALDLSSNYAGTIMAIVNGIGAITGIIAPFLVGLLTPDVSTLRKLNV